VKISYIAFFEARHCDAPGRRRDAAPTWAIGESRDVDNTKVEFFFLHIMSATTQENIRVPAHS
jgi:hypothetical protein